MNSLGFFGRMALLPLKFLSKFMTDGDLKHIILSLVGKRTQELPPAQALKFLFELDAELYIFQSQMSVAYGNGLHTKHRHTKYHDFFVNRITGNEKVMDIGCGNGALAYDIASKSGAEVVGVDMNEKNIDTAIKHRSHPNIRYHVGDALKFPMETTFDVVVLSNVLEHLENRPEFLKRTAESLSPKRILIRVPVFERDWRVPLKEELGLDYRLDSTHFIEYTLETFSSEIAQAGLRISHQEVRWGEIWAEVVPATS